MDGVGGVAFVEEREVANGARRALARAVLGRGRAVGNGSEGGEAMLFHCAYTWFPGTRPEQVWERVVGQDEAGANQPELIRGWYDLAGGGAGYLIVETDDLRDLTAMLRPYMDLMSWDVRAISANDYATTLQQIRDALAQMPPAGS